MQKILSNSRTLAYRSRRNERSSSEAGRRIIWNGSSGVAEEPVEDTLVFRVSPSGPTGTRKMSTLPRMSCFRWLMRCGRTGASGPRKSSEKLPPWENSQLIPPRLQAGFLAVGNCNEK